MKKDIQKHIRTVGLIFIVEGCLYLLAVGCIGVFGLLATGNQAQTGDVALIPAVLTGAAVILPLGLIGIFHILTGKALRSGRNWARIATWILAVVNLGNVPIGTAIGAYAIWVLVNTREELRNIS